MRLFYLLYIIDKTNDINSISCATVFNKNQIYRIHANPILYVKMTPTDHNLMFDVQKHIELKYMDQRE